MDVHIVERTPRRWVGYHLKGPWTETAPEGFGRLTRWVEEQGIEGDWMAIYHGNPNVVAPENLGIDTVISVPADYSLPKGERDIQPGTLAGGKYAMARAVVEDGDFAKPWLALFNEWLPDSDWKVDDRPCFEHYINDGSQSGIWTIDLFIPVR